MCARYAFRKRTAQRVEVLGVPSGRPSNRTTTEPRPGHGAQRATTPRPPDHACMLPPRASPRRPSTAQHSTRRGVVRARQCGGGGGGALYLVALFRDSTAVGSGRAPPFGKAHTMQGLDVRLENDARRPSWGPEASALGWVGVGWVTTSAA